MRFMAIIALLITMPSIALASEKGASPDFGDTGYQASRAVFRLMCSQTNSVSTGTGFLHTSHNIISAAHVVEGCTSVIIKDAVGNSFSGTVTARDRQADLAIIAPEKSVGGSPFHLAPEQNLSIGAKVVTWGYPAGYGGALPMLSVGYIAGSDEGVRNNQSIKRLVVNGAFNRGNSGGPLIDVVTGNVIGLVDAKAVPLSDITTTAMNTLSSEVSGLQYQVTLPDGRMINRSEAQIVELVLNDLAQQVQLVIGYATPADDISSFLRKNKIAP